MKKILAIILLLSSVISLFGCSGGSDVPEGMQLVRGSDSLGYYFYAPEEWQISNYGDISAAYASNIDSSSVSYTEIPAPEGTVEDYFCESLKEFPDYKEDSDGAIVFPKVTVSGEAITFGNADEAKKFVYEHTYSGHYFRTMQIYVGYGSRFGIFTYNSMLENISSPEVVQYDYYEEKIAKVIECFKFVEKGEADEDNKVYETDKDGYKLISDKSVAKFSLYVPDEFKVDASSGLVSASAQDGSNVTLSRATATGVVVSEYWETRKAELSAIAKDVTEISVNTPSSLGNSKQAFSYEYTFVYNNNTYHVYQVLAVTNFNGFVFTYTATEENYSKHIDKVMEIAKKVEF